MRTVCVLVLASAAALLGAWWSFGRSAFAAETADAPARFDEVPAALRELLPDEAEDEHLFQAWLGETIVLGRSPELGTNELPRFAREPGVPVFANIVLPDGREARAVAVRYLPPAPGHDELLSGLRSAQGGPRTTDADAHPVEVVVAKPAERLGATLARLRMLLVLSWVGASILCAAGLAWVVRRGLGPLADLGDQIQAKDETDLGTPFDLPRAAEELEPVIERLNGFRERVGDAIDREHAFAAHAAHELRTPLAGLRSTLEVSLSRERDAAEHRESEQASLEITLQLERLVARLLELSRAASPNTNVDVEAIPLRPLVMESWTPYSDAAADRGVFLESGAEEGWTVHTDRQLFGRVLQNLLENASNYADDGTAVRLEAEEDRGAWTVRVSNRTTGLDAETTRHAFDAFWRSDSAHSAVGRHAGLGLSLCRDVMNRLGGAIEVDGEDDVFRATLRLPPRSAGGARADRSE